MSVLQWRDWSCAVRVVIADDRPALTAPTPAIADHAERAVRDLMDDVARSASRFLAESDLSRVNAAAGRLVPVRRLTLDLVEVALDAARRTDGACDPTIGRHLEAAGYDTDIEVLRANGAGADSVAPRTADWTTVRVDRNLGLLGVPAGLGLDLGATAKAWTADEAAARVEGLLGLPVLVAIGGDVATSGEGTAWRVLVSEHEGGAGTVVTLTQGGLATSSILGRRWTGAQGERHHLIDPSTGAPTQGAMRTASVIADTCVEANTLSTAALVWGSEAPARLAGHAARLVDGDGRVTATAAWPVDGPDDEVAA